MTLLQPKLSLKVAQRQILTPGLMQMVSVLALNKLELKEMINAEITENPILEEIEENVPLLDDVARQEIEHDRSIEIRAAEAEPEKKTDPFDEIDFGSYFQDYLDPGFRTGNNFEITEAPSLENFLSQPGTLTDHIFWQLGSMPLSTAIREAAEYIIGNLNEDGYLTASDEELLAGYLREQLVPEAASEVRPQPEHEEDQGQNGEAHANFGPHKAPGRGNTHAALAQLPQAMLDRARAHLEAGLAVVRQLDPVGIATRDLRECLLVQVEAQRKEFELIYRRQSREASSTPKGSNGETHTPASQTAASTANGHGPFDLQGTPGDPAPLEPGHEPAPPAANVARATNCADSRMEIFEVAACIIDKHLSLLQKRDPRELSKAIGKSVETAQQAIEFIRTLDPRPGQRYNRSDARLIEPDVAFVKRGDEYVVVMNEEDLPTLRLNQGYRRMLTQQGAEKEVKDYVKERYRSALQLMRNIEQRKNTILRTCEAIVRRQTEFLEKGVDALRPMMIKEVAEEIGVHPSTVSRAVSNKYVHTAQGVYELRFFFSEGVNGPEGAGTPLMLLKRKVKKLIEDEDPGKPLTDDQIASMLQSQGINVTRRTVAKYREDMRIPSTHQRRVRG
ncbi:MAG TPA: RNA polymerase sigma-54 factor [Silvibacterium sp.]|jgi:RNA polymerase sigma-54 factor|nr:RNA polymerase sigma-54 factor [Silvibacterium sp.]